LHRDPEVVADGNRAPLSREDPMSSVPPSLQSDQAAATRTVPPLPRRTVVMAGILILIPLIALAVVPLYTSHDPRLFGFPFFYWYSILWVFLTSGFTWTAHVLISRARGEQR
jgi:Protein of unknown function (DUF3311)